MYLPCPHVEAPNRAPDSVPTSATKAFLIKNVLSPTHLTSPQHPLNSNSTCIPALLYALYPFPSRLATIRIVVVPIFIIPPKPP